MRGIKIPPQDFPLKTFRGAYLRDATVYISESRYTLYVGMALTRNIYNT